MNPQLEQLLVYVRQQLQAGIPEANIRQMLLQYNWNPQMVDWAFGTINSQTPQAQTSVITATTEPETVPSDAPKKYRVFRAFIDAAKAARYNWHTLLATVFIGYVIAGIALFIMTLLATMVLGDGSQLYESNIKAIMIFVVCLVLYAIWYNFASVLIMVAPSFSLFDGAQQQRSGFSQTMRVCLQRFVRVLKAQILYAVLAFWPLAALLAYPFVLITVGSDASPPAAVAFILGSVATLAWVIIAFLRYSLAPYIALFEPELPLKQTLTRSKQLLHKGGQWFLIKGVVLLLILQFAVFLVANSGLQIVLFVLLSIVINGTFVMLYRNRKTVIG